MQSVLILEDHADSAELISLVVRTVFPSCVIQLANNIHTAISLSHQYCFNLALVDLNLPDGDGSQFIRYLSQRDYTCSIVVMTIYDDDQHLFDALRAGASGYLLKDSSQQQLVSAVRGIVTGQPPLSSAIARRILRVFNQSNNAETTPPLFGSFSTFPMTESSSSYPSDITPENGLTKREIHVLSLVAKGYSRTEIAQYLGITSHTSASHIKNIYRKLNVGSRAEAAVLADRLGLS